MNNEEIIARINAALGPRKVDCMGIGTAGSEHAANQDKANDGRDKPLYGNIWISEEQRELSIKNNFVWFFDVMVVHEGKLEDRPPEVQVLPAKITVYGHSPAALFDSLLPELLSQWNREQRFKTEQRWYNPGKWKAK
jgi:hypothetical protein